MTLLNTHAEAVEIEGKKLLCLVCGHGAFHRRKAHFETAPASGMAPAWSESEGHCLICERCGHVHGFVAVRPGGHGTTGLAGRGFPGSVGA